MKIVVCSAEMVPFAKTGGLADVAGALPPVLEKLGEDVIVVMPGYKQVSASKIKVKKLKQGVSFAVIGKGVKVYFIDSEQYFDRDGIYGDKTSDYPDNLERFTYYNKKTLELLKELDFKPDIIHCHDWHACLIPVYLKTTHASDPFYKDTKTILTIHNIGYQGLFPKDEFAKTGLDKGFFKSDALEYYGKVNLLKGGILFSDLINTVSPNYALEIQTKEFGFGMEGILKRRRDSVSGILNGLDYSLWDPSDDGFISAKFDSENIEDKYKNRDDLRLICGFPDKDVPLFGIVSRLAEQKGFDILSTAMDKICNMDLQFVILGTGEARYHGILEKLAVKYKDRLSLHLRFDNSL
ncbi:glycogen synthase, partial [Candidatus Omnitrophota bacterium]